MQKGVRNMKKLTCLGLTLAMALSLLAGCGGGNTAAPSDNGGNAGASQSTTAPADTKLSGAVSTNGSTSMEKVILTLNEQFGIDNPDVKVSYDPTGSGTGITSTIEGSCEIGMSSRELKTEELDAGLTPVTIALDGIAVIVNSANAVDALTGEQIRQIFTGELTDWSEVQ